MLKSQSKKVFVAMSGGVDSSVAAFLLKNRGYDVTGVFMRCYNVDGCSEKDAEDARRVAAHLGIPFYVFDFEEEYKQKVVEYMVNGYRQGITPNPDVMCNKEIKFGLFLKKALELGADYIATGHYVRLATSHWGIGYREKQKATLDPIGYTLLAARDASKDQSYFLWTLTQEQLKHCLFPIGDYLKVQVRGIARKAGLPTAEKKDSQGICFLGKVTLADFLKNYIPRERGEVFTTSGQKVGEHEGAYFYTIGQRHGLSLGVKNRELGITGQRNTKPHYVAEKDVKTNTIVVAEGDDNPALYGKEIDLTDVNFINSQSARTIRANCSIEILARIRYRQPLTPALFIIHNSSFKLVFDEPQKFVAPGQSAVFYGKDGEMLGGGIIK